MAGALLVHVVVIALLILVGFTLPEQSEEGGVPVMMGETPDAWGAADPSLVEVETMPEEAAPEMPEEAEQEMLTQEDEETVAIKPKVELKSSKPKITPMMPMGAVSIITINLRTSCNCSMIRIIIKRIIIGTGFIK